MSLEDQLRLLIDASPAHIQRHFACDCAERALRQTKIGDKRSWNATEVSRRYAEGQATVAELNAAWAAAWAAAWDAASNAARSAERKWQIAHLQSILDTYDATRSSLLRVLQQRSESIKPIFVQYAHDLEERAFE